MSMLERAALLAGLALLLAVIVIAVRTWSSNQLRRMRAGGERHLWSTLGETPDGRPSLISFSAPGCIACRTAQRPAVEVVAARFGGALRVMSVDIAERPAVGRAFNVMTAPSTVVLAGDGRVQNLNHGFAPAEVLAGQVSALGASPA
jgi:thioredoxin-like negative regulator of GroEL